MKKLLLAILLLLPIASYAETKQITLEDLIASLQGPPNQNLTLDIPPIFDYGIYSKFQEMERQIRSTTGKSIDLRVTGFGGAITLVNEFGQALLDAEKKGIVVNMDIVGPSYSGHAYITCYTKNVVIRDGASLMFHQAYTNSTHLFGLITTRDLGGEPATDALMNTIFTQCKALGRLTDKDIKEIKAGRDVTISRQGNNLVTTYSEDAGSISALIIQLAELALSAAITLVLIAIAKRI